MTRGVRLGVDGRELRPGVRTGIRRYVYVGFCEMIFKAQKPETA